MSKFSIAIVLSVLLCTSSAYADIERVSVSSSGVQANKGSLSPAISTDGRFVAFYSDASNLVDGTNSTFGIFVHDRDTGMTERVDIFYGERPSISSDGRIVAFETQIALIPDDTNVEDDIYVHDRNTRITERASVSSTGEQANGSSHRPSISADGRYVAFESAFNDVGGIFVHDRNTGTTELVSVSPAGNPGFPSGSNRPSISADGRFVTFDSGAHNFAPDDTNGRTDIFVHDRYTRVTERVSVSSTGVQANHHSTHSTISASGRFVTFVSYASNLVAGDTNNYGDIFVHDRDTGTTERVSVSSAGNQGFFHPSQPSISADGRFVTFYSEADRLVAGDTNFKYDVFIHDRDTAVTERVSVSAISAQANGDSINASISADGRFVTFASLANNLVASDTNDTGDVFVADNPLFVLDSDLITIKKRINNVIRDTQSTAAQLAAGTLFKQSYQVTNNSPNRIYQVKVFEDGNLACNFYSLNPGEIKERCVTSQTVLKGDQHEKVKLMAKISGSGEMLTSNTDAYYTGLTNVTGELRVTHRINNVNADAIGQAPTLGSSQATVSYKVENIGDIEIYQVKTYHDPVSPVNSGWDLLCVLGPMKPGQVRYCKRDIILTESNINQVIGRVQGRNAIRSATNVVNASNPTYFIVP